MRVQTRRSDVVEWFLGTASEKAAHWSAVSIGAAFLDPCSEGGTVRLGSHILKCVLSIYIINIVALKNKFIHVIFRTM